MGKQKKVRFKRKMKGKFDPEGKYTPEVFHFVTKSDTSKSATVTVLGYAAG